MAPTLFPFGVPDGKPGNGEDDPLADFVDLDGREFRRGVGMRADDRRVRVIVGRKGAGKTLYLRRLQVSAAGDRSLYADQWRIDHTPSRDVIRVFDASSSAVDAAERWERIWRRAIMRSVVSHLLHAPSLDAAAGGVDLLAGCERLHSDHGARASPYQEVQNILYERGVDAALDDYLSAPAWNTLQERLRTVLERNPPICFYLDALDDHFERAPMKWLACQKGLCLEVLRLADQLPRLHIVITVRDIVYSALQTSEHMTRYVGTDRIRALDWNGKAIDRLLQVKIEKLPREYLMREQADDPIERWLGQRLIRNAATDEDRPREEILKDYLLRHTRLIPRDIVRLGNSMCELVDELYSAKVLLDPRINATVSRVAAMAGMEELLIVANRITTAGMPRGAAEWEIDESYTSHPADGEGDEGRTWQHVVRERLIRLLRELREDRITGNALRRLVDRGAAWFGDADVVSVMWQHGLLGYVAGPRKTGDAVFYSASDATPMHLSATAHRAYALHPILIDTVGPPMRGVGGVVRPF